MAIIKLSGEQLIPAMPDKEPTRFSPSLMATAFRPTPAFELPCY